MDAALAVRAPSPELIFNLMFQAGAHFMEWRKGRRSDNVVDARGEGGGGGGMRFGGGKGLGLGAILLIVGIGWLTGQDPLQILGQIAGQMDQQQTQTAPAGVEGKAPPVMMSRPSSSPRSWATPKTPGRRCLPRLANSIATPSWCCSAARSILPAASPRRQSGRSTARAISGYTWT